MFARVRADVLSDVLRAVHLTGAAYFDFELSSPWVVEAPPSREIVDKVMPGAQRVIEYHLIARGTGWARTIDEEAPRRLRQGDLIIFPQGDAHVLSSAPGLRSSPDMNAFARVSPLPMLHELGGGGPERARIVCCFLGCDERPFNPVLSALPAVIHLSSHAATPSAGWLGTLMRMAAEESGSTRAGGENVLARLSELMFVETIRRYLENLSSEEIGWLAGLRDPTVGQALSELHRAPQESWTVERLARAVGVSRSVLAERFTAMVGRPPMQYLALWRMQLASRLLLQGGRVAAIASAVGYESESAFSRIFKKLVGQSPAAWRSRVSGTS